MKNHENSDIIDRIQTDKELVAEFTSNMQLITKQTGVELTIDTSRDGVARMRPGDTHVFFNPVYTLTLIQAIQQQRAKEFGISENFTFNISHLSQLVLHEINHMINHAQLKMSDKKIRIGGRKMNMVEYGDFLVKKYGVDFHDFENMLEDVDVNNHATLLQAPVFERAKQDIYHHISIPSADFSKEPLADQFTWTILRESMLPKEKCVIDPRVRACIDYLSEPGEALEKLRDPNLKFDEQLPIIHRLYEEYYLRFKKEDEKNQKENQGKQSGNTNQQGGEQGTEQGGEQGNQGQNGESNQNQNEQGNQNGQSNQGQNGQSGQGGEQGEQGSEGQSQQNGDSGQNQGGNSSSIDSSSQNTASSTSSEGQNQQGDGSQDGQPSQGNESQSQIEGGNTHGKSNQRRGILGNLRDRLRRALGNKEGNKEGDSSTQNSSDMQENSSNSSSSSEEKKSPTDKSENDKSENGEKKDASPKNSSEGDKSEEKAEEKTEEKQKRPPYRPGKPMLLPHIFEDLDEEGNSLIEQIEQSLKGGKNSENSLTQKEKNKSKGENGETGQSQQIQDTIEQAIQEALQQQKEDMEKTPEERSLEAAIQQERGIDGSDRKKMRDIKSAIKRQERLKDEIKKIKDDRGQSVYDKITKDIFSRIVQIRKWNKLGERHARPFSEGGQLDPQNLVSGIMDWKAGDDDPRILEQEYKEQKEKQKAGGFAITFILDGSASMGGEKNRQQALSTLLMLYSLQQLNQDIKLEGGDMEDFLISTQAMMFCGGGEVALLKDRGQELSMKDMIEVTNALGYCDGGSTNAGDAISEYYDQISKPFGRMSQKQYEERKEKVKDGKFKEILFVLSDGGFNSGCNPIKIIKELREMGVIVCGIGITNDGYPILSYFGEKTGDEEKDKQGFGIVCEDAGELGNTLNELLVHHLEDPSIVG